MNKEKKLNLGCGTDYREGWVNLDFNPKLKLDIVHDLNKFPWPFRSNTFDEILAGSNILGFVDNFIKSMEEIHRISKPNAVVNICVPIFPSISCFSDPYTKRVFTHNSFDHFIYNDKLNYYSKARFKIINRKIIFSKKLKLFEIIANTLPKFYLRCINNILPANGMIISLRVLK